MLTLCQVRIMDNSVLGGASTPASPPPSPDQRKMMVSVHRALQVCTKLDSPLIVVTPAQPATTLTNSQPPPARLVHKVTTLTPPDNPPAQPVRLAPTVTRLALLPARPVCQDTTLTPPAHPNASVAHPEENFPMRVVLSCMTTRTTARSVACCRSIPSWESPTATSALPQKRSDLRPATDAIRVSSSSTS